MSLKDEALSVPEIGPASGHNQSLAYVRWAAIGTVFLYTAGYATIGFSLLFLGALWRLVSGRAPLWQPTAVDRPLAAFGAILVLSAVASPYLRVAVPVTLMLLLSGAAYFGSFCWLLYRDPASKEQLLRAWALGVLPTALAGLAAGSLAHGRAWIPQGVGPNGLGTTLLLGTILMAGLSLQARGVARALWLVSGIVSLLGLLATGSRGSAAGLVVGVVYLTWKEMHARPWRLASVLAAGAVVGVLAGAAIPQLKGRVGDTLTDLSHNRIQVWRTSHRMISARPILGTGFGTFERAYEEWKAPSMPSEPFAFNLALNIAVETGLAGLVAALWVAITAISEWVQTGRRAPPRIDPTRPIIAALWIGLLVDQFTDNTLFSISTSAALWLLLAFLVVSPPHSH